MSTHHILIDFENLQPGSLPRSQEVPLKVLIFVGERQSRIPFDLAQSLQNLGEQVEYIKISGNGQNALDFHIAYYIGKLAAEDPEACFHIVSRDKGFDPLIRHLEAEGVLTERVARFEEIHILNGDPDETLDEKVASTIESLRSQGTSRPRRRKTLANTISAIFLKAIPPHEVDAIIDRLESDGIISINNQVVSYQAPVAEKGKAKEKAKEKEPEKSGSRRSGRRRSRRRASTDG